MALGQLYYTSCRTGITGFPGYQFNAVTPGIPIDVMRDVEGLTAYEPPHSLSAAGAEPGRYPVNLCHLPGETTVVASVEFVGEDYSRRSGNYFAHALVAAGTDRDLGGHLPIELWRSAGWVSQPVEQTELPELGQAPPPGPLTPDLVADYLAGCGNDHHLAAMLTAAEAAISEGERKLVIIAEDSDTVAHWVAALSYLLPPHLARAMSFMTYCRQPRYSRTAVVGALPEVDIERSDTGFASYYLFDLVADRASELTVHPLARLLADVGPVNVDELWERVDRYATGAETTFDDLYPLAVAATVGWSAGPDHPRLAPLPLVAWLERRGSALDTALFTAVGDATATALLTACGTEDANTLLDNLSRLVAAAGGRGVSELVSQAEVALAEVLVAGVTRPPAELRFTTEAGRRVAADRLSQRLSALPADGVMAYLRWAHAAGLRLDNNALKRAGVAAAGPALLGPDRPQALDVMRAWLACRQGAIEHLDEAAERDPGPVIELLVAEADALDLDDGEKDANPALGEAALVADVRAGRRPPIAALADAAARRRARGHEPVIDTALVDRFWSEPEWSRPQVLKVLDQLNDKDVVEPGVRHRVAAAVLRPAPPFDQDAEACRQYGELCFAVKRSPAFPALPVAAQERVLDVLDAEYLVRGQVEASKRRKFKDGFATFCERVGDGSPDLRRRVEDELLREYSNLWIADLVELTLEFGSFRRRLVAMLAGKAGHSSGMSEAYLLWRLHIELGGDQRPGARSAQKDVDDVTLPALKRWRRHDIQRLEELLGKRKGPDAAAALAAWADGDGASVTRRLFRALTNRPAPEEGKGKDKNDKKKK